MEKENELDQAWDTRARTLGKRRAEGFPQSGSGGQREVETVVNVLNKTS